ncbi:hypothetical protein HDU91_000990, partial [Kappamyces sp. JEL0680]
MSHVQKEKALQIEDPDALNEFETENDVWIAAAVTKEDNPDTPALTFRTLFLGIIWAIFLAIANAIFSFRTNYFIIPSTLALLLAYPMGLFLAAVLPRGILNPGPFSVKEHALIYIIANAAGGLPYGVDNVIVQAYPSLINNQSINFLNSLPWVLSTQFIGYGVA